MCLTRSRRKSVCCVEHLISQHLLIITVDSVSLITYPADLCLPASQRLIQSNTMSATLDQHARHVSVCHHVRLI